MLYNRVVSYNFILNTLFKGEWSMTREEYLKAVGGTVTFIIAEAVKESHSPFWSFQYRPTPVMHVDEWLSQSNNDKYIVINADHPPIDITGHHLNRYNQKYLNCAIITTEEDLKQMYSEKQAQEMIEYYKRTVTV